MCNFHQIPKTLTSRATGQIPRMPEFFPRKTNVSNDGEAVVASDTVSHHERKEKHLWQPEYLPIRNRKNSRPVLNEVLYDRSHCVIVKLTWDNNNPFFCLRKTKEIYF